MKRTYITQFAAAFAALTLTCGAVALADEAVTTTTTTAGTISEFSPDTIVVRSETSPEPIRYSYSKTTTYVDDAGVPVAREIIKSGVPVTIHYVREGDRVIANRVIVHTRNTTAAPAEVEERKTTTAPAQIEEKRTTTTTTESGDRKERKEKKEREEKLEK